MPLMTATVEAAVQPVDHTHVLPMDRADWSAGAHRAYDQVLAELDSWSRKHDASKTLNSWIAEEAVRQVW
jgi:hypothetical protein